MIKFISYDGAWPNYCSGVLKIEVDGKEYALRKYTLVSGGRVTFDANWSNAKVYKGPWKIDEDYLPDELKSCKSQIEAVVNENVPFGCCGGCI